MKIFDVDFVVDDDDEYLFNTHFVPGTILTDINHLIY